MMPIHRISYLLLSMSLVLLVGATNLLAQEDDPLNRLMREIEGGSTDEAESAGQDQLEEKDEALDSLLGGFGGLIDQPDASGDAPELPPGLRPDRPETLNDQARERLSKEEQTFDEYLRELVGWINPDKDKEQQSKPQDGQEGGPLADTMKKMREVENRLSKLDTGEQTQEQQQKIIDDFDQLIRQIRSMQQQGQSKPQEPTQMAGQQQQQGENQSPDQTGTNNGAPPVMPNGSDDALAGARESWFHLQGALRDVMGNVTRMVPLGKKRELINRYFLSVAEKSIDP